MAGKGHLEPEASSAQAPPPRGVHLQSAQNTCASYQPIPFPGGGGRGSAPLRAKQQVLGIDLYKRGHRRCSCSEGGKINKPKVRMKTAVLREIKVYIPVWEGKGKHFLNEKK